MSVVASICSSCGLIAVALKAPRRGSGCIKCGEHTEIVRASDTDELWAQFATDPPAPYAESEVQGILKTRYAKALQRFSERAKARRDDKQIGPEWKASAYFARKGMLEAALRSRPRRRRARTSAL